MAYTHSKHEVLITAAGDLTSAAQAGLFSPGFVPHTLRAIAIVITTATSSTGDIVIAVYRNTANTTTTTNRVTVDTITIPTSIAVGKVYYVDGLDTEVSPGQEIQVTVTTAATSAGTAYIKAYVEPHFENPSNNSSMVQSA